MPAVRQILRRIADDDYRFSSLVLGIVTSDPFQQQAVPVSGGLSAMAAGEQ
jgi:hypothetical protein